MLTKANLKRRQLPRLQREVEVSNHSRVADALGSRRRCLTRIIVGARERLFDS